VKSKSNKSDQLQGGYDESKQGGNSASLSEIRKEFPKAYEPWTSGEDHSLEQDYANGKSLKEMSEKFERTEGAIIARLRKLYIQFE
jgi:hypothetical protein